MKFRINLSTFYFSLHKSITRIVVSSYLSVRPYICFISEISERISIEFHIGVLLMDKIWVDLYGLIYPCMA
jgi:hypothetical protein